MQLTKKATIEGIENGKDSIEVMKLVIDNLKVNEEKCKESMTKELYATEEMYKLIEKGIPLREAYKKISKRYQNEKNLPCLKTILYYKYF